MDPVLQAYAEGFARKCAEEGINPEALVKFAQFSGLIGGQGSLGQMMSPVKPQVGPAGGQLMAPASPRGTMPTAPNRRTAAPQAPIAAPANPITANLAMKKQLMAE